MLNSNRRFTRGAAFSMTGDFAIKPPSDSEVVDKTIVDTDAFLNTLKFERVSSTSDQNCDEFFGHLLGERRGTLGIVRDEALSLLQRKVDPVVEIQKPVEHEEYTPYNTQPIEGETLLVPRGLQTYGLPIVRPKMEAWRYFNVREWVTNRYMESATESTCDLENVQVALEGRGAWLDDEECHARLIYIDGQFSEELSKVNDFVSNIIEIKNDDDPKLIQCLNRLPDGFTEKLAYEEVEAESLQSKIEEDPDLIMYSKLSKPNHNMGHPLTNFAINLQSGNAAFCALNSVKCESVAHVNIPSQKDVEKPIIVVHVASDGGAQQSYPRTLVRVGAESNASLQQFSIDLGGKVSKFTNGVTQVYLSKGAKLDHNILEDSVEEFEKYVDVDGDAGERERERVGMKSTTLSHVDVHVAEDANYSPTLLHYSSIGNCRTILQISLLEHASSCDVSSLNLTGGLVRSQQDFKVHHIDYETISKQNQRTMCGGRSTTVFRGAIRVEREGQQTDAEQLAKSIMVSDRARTWAIPSLEIIADDVTCTHGATVSDLSEEELFYLRSRGMDRQLARNLLMGAFINEICDKVNGPNRQKVSSVVKEYLEAIAPRGDRAIKGDFQSV